MELSPLLLPVIGGYLFLALCRFFSHGLAKDAPAILTIKSACVGVLLLLIARLLVSQSADFENNLTLSRWAWNFAALAIAGIALGVMSLALTSWIERASAVVSAGRKRLGWVIFCGAAFMLAYFYPRVDLYLLSRPLYFVGLLIALFILALCWAKKFHVSAGHSLLRLSTTLAAFTALVLAFAYHFQSMDELRTDLVAPLGGNAANIGTAFLAFVLGPLIAAALNQAFPTGAAQEFVYRRESSTGLEQLIFDASQKEMPLSLTLSHGKVYVGYVRWVPSKPKSDNAYIEIVPIISGYRAPDTKEVVYTTPYHQVYQDLPRDAWQRFRKVLPISSIVVAGEFDLQYFDSGDFEGESKEPRGSGGFEDDKDRAASRASDLGGVDDDTHFIEPSPV